MAFCLDKKIEGELRSISGNNVHQNYLKADISTYNSLNMKIFCM